MLALSCFTIVSIKVITGEKENNINKGDPSCPIGWEKMEDHCYLCPAATWMSWADAEQFCKEKDGHLASVTSLNQSTVL